MKRPKPVKPANRLSSTPPPPSRHSPSLSRASSRTIKISLQSTSPPARLKTRKALAPHFSAPPGEANKNLPSLNGFLASPDFEWTPLNVERSELSLPLTLLTGQTFRWKQTGPSQFTGVVKSHLFSLKQLDNDVGYFLHFSRTNSLVAEKALIDYLNLKISTKEMWAGFVEADSRFAALAPHVAGIRVLRQDPLECLFQFICSSNNNIGRITKMVDHLSSFGSPLGSVGGFDFYEFPSLEELAHVSEERLRNAGFGYRARYIAGTVKALLSKPGGGVEWLSSLRKLELQEATASLCTLPGIGPKVAACVALFSLDQNQAVPVDTHVWQIATRYFLPELEGAKLTSKLCQRVSEAFVSKFGKYAGWAQTVLFVSELPMQQALLPSDLYCKKKSPQRKSSHKKAEG
ncbi:N-glycosylase/DNA lyase OGG1 [Nymphaea colorata]|nr:N-glycosylase/DNA lyase OGG1 [Nymphaea colorata]